MGVGAAGAGGGGAAAAGTSAPRAAGGAGGGDDSGLRLCPRRCNLTTQPNPDFSKVKMFQWEWSCSTAGDGKKFAEIWVGLGR